MNKVNILSDNIRTEARKKQDKKISWLVQKYSQKDAFVLPDELSEYKDCKVFLPMPDKEAIPGEGPLIVLDEGESLFVSEEEIELMELGPKFCVGKGCIEEQYECDIETTIVKEKWDRMGRDLDDDDTNLNYEEAKDKERVEQLAEELAAQAMMAHDDDTKIWSGAGLRVTDYKANTRVILPKALSPLEESKLEVLRMELIHHSKEWISNNCDCKGNQPSNLSKGAQ